MSREQHSFSVFEHESLRSDRGDKRLSDDQLKALQLFYGDKGVPYYSLIHNGVRFNEFVGVLQIGKTLIEVLPKADKSNDHESWIRVLIGMLKAVGVFDIHAPSNSELTLKHNSILDLYFELFIKEIEQLLHKGLIKKYRITEGNRTSLKGSIQFSKHIQQNLIHQERFYVKHTTYDLNHDIHAILYKALKLIDQINTNVQLNSRLGVLSLVFPELYDIKVTDSDFDRIVYNRKTEPYRNALEVARLILLNYHPDVKQGTNNVLALMFDMNMLWEQFVYASLRKFKPKTITVEAQTVKNFWRPQKGRSSSMKPDIVINKGKEDCAILDTKWKNLNGRNPSPEDLKQMFVYMKYYRTKKVALLYPGPENFIKSGLFYDHSVNDSRVLSHEECSILSIQVEKKIKDWQKEITHLVDTWSTSTAKS